MSKGIYQKNNGRWVAMIGLNYKLKNLGTYDTFDEAERARKNAELVIDNKGSISDLFKLPRLLSERQKSIITGSLLGDGMMNSITGKQNSFFCKKQAAYRREYLVWHQNEFPSIGLPLCKGKGHSPHYPNRETSNLRFYTRRDPVFTEYRRKWYPLGTKIVPSDIQLDSLSVAMWFADDGSHSNGQCRFCTHSFTDLDRSILIAELGRLKIPAYQRDRQIYIRGRYPQNLLELIKPHFVWKCFEYKITGAGRGELFS